MQVHLFNQLYFQKNNFARLFKVEKSLTGSTKWTSEENLDTRT